MAAPINKRAALTAVDVDHIANGNFVPDIKKLADEIGINRDDPFTLRAIGARVVTDYGVRKLSKAVDRAEIIYGGDDREISNEVFRGTYQGEGAGIKKVEKRTTKAEAVARHMTALIRLLENEPDAIVGPILDNLLERLNWARLEYVTKKLETESEP
jgi:hypothetical protein